LRLLRGNLVKGLPQFDFRPHTQLLVDVLQMASDRMRRAADPVGNVPVRRAFCIVFGDLAFRFGQKVCMIFYPAPPSLLMKFRARGPRTNSPTGRISPQKIPQMRDACQSISLRRWSPSHVARMRFERSVARNAGPRRDRELGRFGVDMVDFVDLSSPATSAISPR
jgi:hypothetical protein